MMLMRASVSAGSGVASLLFGLTFGETNAASRIVYGLVGLAGLVGAGAG